MLRFLNRKALLIWVIIFTLLVAYALYRQRDLNTKGNQAHQGLCAIKDQAQAQLDATRIHLREVLNGTRAPTPGVAISDRLQSIQRQRIMLLNLESVKC